MDRATLLAFESHWGEETNQTLRDLPRLTDAERDLYDQLRDNRLKKNLRLEQERIGFGWVAAACPSPSDELKAEPTVIVSGSTAPAPEFSRQVQVLLARFMERPERRAIVSGQGLCVASDSQFYADLSGKVTGVFASTFMIFERETPIEIVVSLPNVGSFRARGAVQFVRTAADGQLPGLGIVFTKIEPSDYEAVTEFGRSFRAPMFYDEA